MRGVHVSIMKSVQDQWNAWKPFLKGLVAGVIAGPILMLWLGWMVTSSAMEGQVRASLVKAEASICAARALREVPEAAKLDYQALTKLAEKWAVMPGQKKGAADYDVTRACTDILAETPKGSAS